MSDERKPTHPGEAFKIEVLEELGVTVTSAAKLLGVGRQTLSSVLNGNSRLSVTMAKRFGMYTNTSTGSWYNMQTKLDLWEVEQSEEANDIKFYGEDK